MVWPAVTNGNPQHGYFWYSALTQLAHSPHTRTLFTITHSLTYFGLAVSDGYSPLYCNEPPSSPARCFVGVSSTNVQMRASQA